MAKRTKVVLPASNEVLVIADNVTREDLSLIFMIEVETYRETFQITLESERDVVAVALRLESIEVTCNVPDLGNWECDHFLTSEWPFDGDEDEYYNLVGYDIYWVDAQHVLHDVTVEHIGEVHAEETELEPEAGN